MTKDNDIPILSLYDQYLSTFRERLKALDEKLSKKRIHKLRVAMKHLRISGSIIEALTGQALATKKHRKRLKKLFKVAGAIREAQINRELVQKYDRKNHLGIELYQRYQAVKIDIHKEELTALLPRIKWKKFRPRFDHYNYLRLKYPNKKVRAFLKKSIQEELQLIRKLRKKPREKKLHDIRKELKRIHAIATHLEEEKPTTGVEQLLVLMKDTEVAIGKWHDLEILLASVRKFREDTRQSSIINFSLHHLIQDIERDKQLLGTKVWKLLETF